MDAASLPDAVADYLAAERTELVDVAETLVGYDTRNPPGHTAAIADRIGTMLDDAGLEVDRLAVDPEKPNLLATLPGATDHTVCFNGHLDTVPFDAGDWSRDPLGERLGDRLYGRGTTDMKGAVAAMVHVALAHARTGTEPPVTLLFALVSDEETGGDAGLTTVLDEPGFGPDACVVGETTSRNGRYSVSVADRGNVWLTITATGTAAHGSRPMIGVNAIDRLTDAIERLRTEFGGWELPIDPAMDAVIAESVGFYEPEAGAEATRELYRYPTINLGTIEGGTAINTVPASATAEVDVRLTASVDTGEVLRSIRGCFDGLDGVEITDVSWTRGSYEPLDGAIVEATAAAAGRVVDDRGIDREGTWWQNYYVTGEPHWRALQLDQVGGPIYAHWLVRRETGDDDLLDEHYDMSRRAAEFLLSYDNGYGFPRKHQDPWEEVWGYSTEGAAAAIAGLRAMAELADANGDDGFAERCRDRADVWASNLETYCFKPTPHGDCLVTADSPETPADPPADARPDAASFMAVWPWNVLPADGTAVSSTLSAADDEAWVAGGTPCLGRYPGDHYTPSGTAEDGGWPLCEAYADVARWLGGTDPDAVDDHVSDHAHEWTTSAGLLPERVDGAGRGGFGGTRTSSGARRCTCSSSRTTSAGNRSGSLPAFGPTDAGIERSRHERR
jgi:succinyl-diaminopimelate desuccinylase